MGGHGCRGRTADRHRRGTPHGADVLRACHAWQKVAASPAKGLPAGVQESDEQMLVEIDAALTRSRTKEFRALDELTPRVADARARSRDKGRTASERSIYSPVTPPRDDVDLDAPTVPVYWGVVQPLIFRKGLDLKDAVKGDLARDYHSDVVERIRTSDFRYDEGRLTIHLAREFGFCYGVDRAVDYAYQARKRFADQRVFLTGEIIHNPHVNEKLRDGGHPVPERSRRTVARVWAQGDVVIIPAFGVTVHELARLQALGCTLVDTTCGSVLNVWKNVNRYAREGFTAVIHGKVKHEETQATASQALKTSGGRYLVVLDRAEAEHVCDYIRGAATARRSWPGSARPSRPASTRTATSSASASRTRRRC